MEEKQSRSCDRCRVAAEIVDLVHRLDCRAAEGRYSRRMHEHGRAALPVLCYVQLASHLAEARRQQRAVCTSN